MAKQLIVLYDDQVRSVSLPTDDTENVSDLVVADTITRVARPLAFTPGKLCSNNDNFIGYSVKKGTFHLIF